ncbi:MAG TPA: hypothetical protein VLH86_04985 [Patescibacteria group bacterium]|nr:hypothetical protein [Patescibacteria group bacterium]
MSHDLALILALGVPTLMIVVLRINAAMVFLSLCAGAVLVEYVAPQADDLMNLITPRAGAVSNSTLALILLLAPAIVTSVVTLLSVNGRVRVLVNALPAAAASMLAVLLAVPQLPKNIADAFEKGQAWSILSKAEALVVGGGALMSLFFLWSQRRNFKQHDKRRH